MCMKYVCVFLALAAADLQVVIPGASVSLPHNLSKMYKY